MFTLVLATGMACIPEPEWVESCGCEAGEVCDGTFQCFSRDALPEACDDWLLPDSCCDSTACKDALCEDDTSGFSVECYSSDGEVFARNTCL